MTATDKIFSRVRSAGFTTEAACALLANIQAESAFNSINLEDTRNRSLGMSDEEYTRRVDAGIYQDFVTDSAGYGLAQWTYWTRKQELIMFVRQRGVSVGDFDTQMDFLLYEMKKDFPGCWNICTQSHDLYEITRKLLYEWENPQEKEKNMTVRYGYAQNWYQKYQNWDGSIDGDNDSGGERMTQEQAIEKVLTLARGEIGYHEQGDNWTKYAAELDKTNWYNGPKNGYAWCDVFVDWLFYKCFGDPLGREMICQPTGSAGAGCLYSAQYYKGAGRWHTTGPQAGDQIFFTYSPGEYSHTGIVESVSGGTVTTIEGNTSDSVGRRSYSVGSSNIAGYGRPKWELAAESSGGGSTPTPTPSPSGDEGFSRILKRGMRGEDVRRMQEMLIQLGYGTLLEPDGADGDFGNNTYNAVVQFQMANGLYVDGEAGPDTLGKMQELCKAETEPEPDPQPEPEPDPSPVDQGPQPESLKLLRPGDKGVQVKLAQAALSCWGYSVTADGMYTAEFAKKISAFQSRYDLEVDGIVGSETWKKLMDLPIA